MTYINGKRKLKKRKNYKKKNIKQIMTFNQILIKVKLFENECLKTQERNYIKNF